MFRIFNGTTRGLGEQPKNNVELKINVTFRDYLMHFKGAKLAVFMAIALHSDAQGWSRPTIKQLKRETGYEAPTVSSAVTQLCKMEINGERVLMAVQERGEHGSFEENRYLIFPTASEITRYAPILRKPRHTKKPIHGHEQKTVYGETSSNEGQDGSPSNGLPNTADLVHSINSHSVDKREIESSDSISAASANATPRSDDPISEVTHYLEAKAGHEEQEALPLDDASEETPPSVANVPPSLETPRELEAIAVYLRAMNLKTISRLGMLTELYALKRMLPMQIEIWGMPQTEAPLINAIRLMNINDMGPAEAEDKLRQLREIAFAGTVGTVPQSVAPSLPARHDLPEVPSGYEGAYSHVARHYCKAGSKQTLCHEAIKAGIIQRDEYPSPWTRKQCPDCARIAAERAAKPAKVRKPSAYSDKSLYDALAKLYGAEDEADKKALNGRVGKVRKALVDWSLEKLKAEDMNADLVARLIRRLDGFKAWYIKACEKCSLPLDDDKFMTWWIKYIQANPMNTTTPNGRKKHDPDCPYCAGTGLAQFANADGQRLTSSEAAALGSARVYGGDCDCEVKHG